MIKLACNLIIAHVSMNELHIKKTMLYTCYILNNSIVNIIITHADIFYFAYRGHTYATRKIRRCCLKKIFDIEFNCPMRILPRVGPRYPLPVDKGD